MRSSSTDLAIIELLTAQEKHLTSLEIYEAVRRRLPAVNQSTIYRSLDRLAQLGKVSVSDMGTGAAVYEIVGDHMHHHLVCTRCEKVITLEHKDAANFFSQILDKQDFEVHTNHLILFGLCGECRKALEMEDE
jgi:Fur family ferric uptake transcriptional regulator